MQINSRRTWFGQVVKIIIPIMISGLAIWLIVKDIDLLKFGQAVKSISLLTIFFASVTYLIGLMLRVFSWHIILKKQFPLKRVFYVMNAGYLLNNVFPFRLGEIGRAILLGSNHSDKPKVLEVLSSIILERIYDIFLASIFFLSLLPLVVSTPSLRTLAVIMLVLVVGGFIFIFILTRKRATIVEKLTTFQGKGKRLIGWLTPKIDLFLQGFSVLSSFRLVILSFLLMLLSWILSMIQQGVLQSQLMPGGEWWWVIFVLAAGAFGGALPSAPANLGVYEAAVVGAFVLVGVDENAALAFALIVHAIQFVFSTIFGLIGLLTEGQSIGKLVKKARWQKQIVNKV